MFTGITNVTGNTWGATACLTAGGATYLMTKARDKEHIPNGLQCKTEENNYLFEMTISYQVVLST